MENKHLDNSNLQPRKWLLYVLIVVSIIISIVLVTKIITDKKNKVNDEWSIIDKFFDIFGEAYNDALNNNGFFDDNEANENDSNSNSNNNYLSEFEKRAFNTKLEMYVGTNYGSQVSSLIDIITTNNKTNTNHILTVVFKNINSTDSDEIRNIKKQLDDWSKYEVILDYDDNGFVNLITIE